MALMEPSNWGRLRCFKSLAVRIHFRANDRQGLREKPDLGKILTLLAFLWGIAVWCFRASVVIILLANDIVQATLPQIVCT